MQQDAKQPSRYHQSYDDDDAVMDMMIVESGRGGNDDDTPMANNNNKAHPIPMTDKRLSMAEPCSHHQHQQQSAADHQHHSLSQAFQTYLSHDKDEQTHWEGVCQAYRQYATFALCSWNNQCNRIDNYLIPNHQKALLPKGLQKGTPERESRTKLYKDAAIRNQFCLDCILRHAGMAHSQQVGPAITKVVGDGQISKVSSVLKSLARDWSLEGKAERDMAYGPILSQVQKYIPKTTTTTTTASSQNGGAKAKICVPGAGEFILLYYIYIGFVLSFSVRFVFLRCWSFGSRAGNTWVSSSRQRIQSFHAARF